MNKLKNGFSKMGQGWSKMSWGKKSYVILWIITGAFLATLIVMFVSLNSNFKDVKDPHDGWTLKEQSVGVGETKPANTTYTVQTVNARNAYETINTAKEFKDFKGYFNENAFLVNGERLSSVVKTVDGKKYRQITTATTPWANHGQEFISEDNFRGWFKINKEGKEEFVKRTPIYVADAWNTTPTDEAKSSTTATATVAFIWAVLFTGAIITTVVVSKKEKGGRK